LERETGTKCAYCEAFVGDVAYAHVEHILPKSRRPELAHSWQNLTCACPRCNGNKADYYQPTLPIVNPYVDNVPAHLVIVGSLVTWRPGDERGEQTVKTLKLGRLELTQRRTDRLLAVREAHERWHAATSPRKEVLEAGIREDALAGEFPSAVVSFLEVLGFPWP
jgi:hypothetical protein